MIRALLPATHERLRDALRTAGADCALAFAEAVVTQVAHPIGAGGVHGTRDHAAGLARETMVADAIVALAGAAPVSAARPALHADARFLSACFQNMDLLPAHGCAAGDRIALRLADAIAHLPHAVPGGPP